MNTNKLLRSQLLNRFSKLNLLLFLFLLSLSAVAQSSAEVTELLQTRNDRISQSLDTREIDLQLYANGYLPKAVITQETLGNGQLRIVFPTYLPIPEGKNVRIEERLGTHYASTLFSIHVDPVLEKVTLIVPAATTTEQLDAIFDHFGYKGHE